MDSLPKHCKYCGQCDTKLDNFGYCIEYECFQRAGKRDILDVIKHKASDIYLLDKSTPLSIRSYVTNNFNPRDRAAEKIQRDCIREFGFIPQEVRDSLPPEQQNFPQWDRKIRW